MRVLAILAVTAALALAGCAAPPPAQDTGDRLSPTGASDAGAGTNATTGNATGNVTGNVRGNVTGNVTAPRNATSPPNATGNATSNATGAEPPFEVSVVDNLFQPDLFTVEEGITVRFTNTGQSVHSVTIREQGNTTELFSQDLVPGTNLTFAFAEPGEFRLRCMYHSTSYMEGQVGHITVEET